MIKCQTCGTENLDRSQFCDECGAELRSFATNIVQPEAPVFQPPPIPETPFYQPPPSPPQQQQQQQQAAPPETPFFQSANVTSVGIPMVVEEIKPEEKPVEKEPTLSKGGVHATLVIERGESVGTEFTLTSDESTIGRWDADNGIFPDVDLDAHDPEAKVSRRHARIRRETGGKYVIEDLGSTNGTYINRGRRLIPGNPNMLNDGDEIIVGKTFLRFYVNH